ncbi:hypothetical protein BGX24_001977 [Mortierella sp. AD032]|nr:hypothetical protein BGX24_001977 [Mortierella sp. AD032]
MAARPFGLDNLLDPSRDPSLALFFDKSQSSSHPTPALDPDSTDLVVPDLDPVEHELSVPSLTPSLESTTTATTRPVLEQWLQRSLASSSSTDTAPVTNDPRQNGYELPLCSISPDVAPLVSVNVLYHVFEKYGLLPSRISPVGYDTPLPTYLIELPSASPSKPSTIRVTASWPSVRHSAIGGRHRYSTSNLPVPAALNYEQRAPASIKTYLHNNHQLWRMGLAGTESPQQNSPTTSIANSTSSTPAPLKDLNSTHFNMWSSAHYSTTPSDKIISRDTELNRKAWPAIHCIKKSDQLSSSNMPNRTKESSDNVPLFLSQREPDRGEGLDRFEPTILMKRFEKWRNAQDELHLSGSLDNDLKALDVDEDLRLLEEEGEFLFRNNLNLEDYKGLCEKHRLQRVLQTTTRQDANVYSLDAIENIMDQFVCMDHDDVPTAPGSSEDQGTIVDNADAGDLSLTGQDPVMELPRIVGWAAFNSDVMQTKSSETVRGMVDPDFVLEQDLTSPTDKIVRGTLKQIWPRLDSVQQRHLLRLLARMLIVVWDNFDFLDDEQHDTTLADQGQDVSPDDQEEIHCQTRPDGAGPWAKQNDADYNTTAAISGRQSAEDRLRQVEEEFMNRSFLDAIREATKPVQSQPVEHRDQNTDDHLTLPSGNAFSVPGVAGRESNVGGTSTPGGAHSPWNLDDYDKGQRMTTTRARAKASLVAQDRTFILPLRPSDARQRLSRAKVCVGVT